MRQRYSLRLLGRLPETSLDDVATHVASRMDVDVAAVKRALSKGRDSPIATFASLDEIRRLESALDEKGIATSITPHRPQSVVAPAPQVQPDQAQHHAIGRSSRERRTTESASSEGSTKHSSHVSRAPLMRPAVSISLGASLLLVIAAYVWVLQPHLSIRNEANSATPALRLWDKATIGMSPQDVMELYDDAQPWDLRHSTEDDGRDRVHIVREGVTALGATGLVSFIFEDDKLTVVTLGFVDSTNRTRHERQCRTFLAALRGAHGEEGSYERSESPILGVTTVGALWYRDHLRVRLSCIVTSEHGVFSVSYDVDESALLF